MISLCNRSWGMKYFVFIFRVWVPLFTTREESGQRTVTSFRIQAEKRDRPWVVFKSQKTSIWLVGGRQVSTESPMYGGICHFYSSLFTTTTTNPPDSNPDTVLYGPRTIIKFSWSVSVLTCAAFSLFTVVDPGRTRLSLLLSLNKRKLEQREKLNLFCF